MKRGRSSKTIRADQSRRSFRCCCCCCCSCLKMNDHLFFLRPIAVRLLFFFFFLFCSVFLGWGCRGNRTEAEETPTTTCRAVVSFLFRAPEDKRSLSRRTRARALRCGGHWLPGCGSQSAETVAENEGNDDSCNVGWKKMGQQSTQNRRKQPRTERNRPKNSRLPHKKEAYVNVS